MANILQENNENYLNPNKNSKTDSKSFKSPTTSPNSMKNQPNLNTKSNSQREPNNLIPVFNLSFSPNRSTPDSNLPYNPLTNYTSQRPEFLRYNPNRKKEIFLSIEQEIKDEKEEGFEKMSCLKRIFNIVLLFACLVLSVQSINSFGLKEEFELNTEVSEINGFGENFLSEMIGLSYICLNRNSVDFTCGIEERQYNEEDKPIEEILPNDLSGFESKENLSFSGDEFELEEKETVETLVGIGIGSLAQQDKEDDLILVNSSDSQLEELIETDLVDSDKPIDLKTQVYLLYSLQALACFSILIALITSLRKYIGKKLRKNPKPVIEILGNEYETKKNTEDLVNEKSVIENLENEFEAAKNLVNERPIFMEKKNEFSGVKTPQVELLAEFSFGEINMENVSLVKGFGGNRILSNYKSSVMSERKKNLFEEAKENVPFGFDSSLTKMQKKEEIKEQKEAVLKNEIITPLRRSSRIRTKIISP